MLQGQVGGVVANRLVVVVHRSAVFMRCHQRLPNLAGQARVLWILFKGRFKSLGPAEIAG